VSIVLQVNQTMILTFKNLKLKSFKIKIRDKIIPFKFNMPHNFNKDQYLINLKDIICSTEFHNKYNNKVRLDK